LYDLSKILEKDIVKADKEIQELAGATFNVSSPKQVGEVLFEKMKNRRKASRRQKQASTPRQKMCLARSKANIPSSRRSSITASWSS
jgi:DNA polymerase-1